MWYFYSIGAFGKLCFDFKLEDNALALVAVEARKEQGRYAIYTPQHTWLTDKG